MLYPDLPVPLYECCEDKKLILSYISSASQEETQYNFAKMNTSINFLLLMLNILCEVILIYIYS